MSQIVVWSHKGTKGGGGKAERDTGGRGVRKLVCLGKRAEGSEDGREDKEICGDKIKGLFNLWLLRFRVQRQHGSSLRGPVA